MALKERKHGEEHPFIKLGILKLRIPFIHTKWEWPEALQGAVLVTVAMGAIPLTQEALGCSFEVALTMMILNGILYLLHPLFGDPVFPGWITPAIPLTMAYLAGFEAGVDRIHAVIALQFSMGIVFTVLGVTGLAKKLVGFVPTAIRAGIILGAGIGAVHGVIKPGGRMAGIEWTILVGTAVCYLTMFSYKFLKAKDTNKLFKLISKYGMIPGFVAAAIVGYIFKELPVPDIQMGFTKLYVTETLEYTVFGVGFPAISYFIQALPLVAAAYIIAFGDFVLAEVVTREADEERGDEIIDFNPNRSNLITGIRNFIMSIFSPYAALNGPLWAGGTIAIAERYKHGRKEMDSIFGGLSTFTIAMAVIAFISPIVSLLRPILPAGLSLTLTVQGFACAYIAMDMVKTKEERGIAGIMAIFLAFRGSAWGLAVGIVAYILVGVDKEKIAMIEAREAEELAAARKAREEKAKLQNNK